MEWLGGLAIYKICYKNVIVSFVDLVVSENNVCSREINWLSKKTLNRSVIRKKVSIMNLRRLTEEAARVTEIPFVMDAYREEAEEILDAWITISKERGDNLAPCSLLSHESLLIIFLSRSISCEHVVWPNKH
ncbi:MAG: hypothetical protein MUO26_05575 [Methanotrichaceae archaeon]|nr:hypothetical protein [Methanotrichaceae archaeon]